MTTDEPLIQKTPGVMGGEACIRRTRIAVWGIVSWKRLGMTDEWFLENYPGLTHQDLDAAQAYYETNREEVDRAIRENEEAE